MMGYLWMALGLSTLGFLGYRGGRVWWDAHQRHMRPRDQVGWALLGAVVPTRYWWGARIEAMSEGERQALLTQETRALGLRRADSLRCPLCGAEISHAWTLTTNGRAAIAQGPVECPGCDFRLDACRHCAYLLPGPPQAGLGSPWVRGDLSSGRCSLHSAAQPVEEACTPDIARQLRARGYDQIRAPLPIVDSFLPPDRCRAFAPERKRLQQGRVRWPDARRTALLRLVTSPVPQRASAPQTAAQGDELWLL
jgi:hypothetical protein